MPRHNNSTHSTKQLPRLPTNTPVNEHVLMERLTHWKEIREYLGWTEGKIQKWRREMLSDGIIFKEHSGSPPKLQVFTFTSLLHRWLMVKTLQGSVF